MDVADERNEGGGGEHANPWDAHQVLDGGEMDRQLHQRALDGGGLLAGDNDLVGDIVDGTAWGYQAKAPVGRGRLRRTR